MLVLLATIDGYRSRVYDTRVGMRRFFWRLGMSILTLEVEPLAVEVSITEDDATYRLTVLPQCGNIAP